MNKQASKSEPISIIASLSAGFDAVTRAPQVILVPVLLDLFLWLGPRLSAYPLAKSVVALMSALPATPDETMRAQFTQALALLDQAGKQFDLFAWLSPTLIGAPSLMAGTLSDKQPWAQAPSVWEVNNILVYFGLFGLFSLAGLGISALYWSQLARAALKQRPGRRSWLAHGGRIWWGLCKLVALLIVLGLVIGMPVLIVSAMVALFSPALAQFSMLMGLTILMWAAFYLVFVVHGLALRDGTFIEAVRISLGLIRAQFFPSVGLLLLGWIIYLGLGVVWNLPAGDSWLKAGAIVGHAFVASGVLCATAFFYLDRVQATGDQAPGTAARTNIAS